MKKGFYFIIANQKDKDNNTFWGPFMQEGSYEYHGRLFIHRPIDNKYDKNRWKVSHVESGAGIVSKVNLNTARHIVKSLQGFSLWELKTWDQLEKAIKLHHLGYQEEVRKIEQIRQLRA